MKRFRSSIFAFTTILAIVPEDAWASLGHDPSTEMPRILFALAVILLGAIIGRAIAGRLGLPSVLGELGAGIVLGNMVLFGWDSLAALSRLDAIHVLAEIGVILLLFEVGLHLNLKDMTRVGISSLLVALVGIIGPFLLGWAVGHWLYPQESIYMHLFLGAILTATSVGITARVLKDLRKLETDEARIVLGAAVIDDVFGLIILAIMTGFIGAANDGAGMSVGTVGWLAGKAMLFLVGSMLIGRLVIMRILRRFGAGATRASFLILALGGCFLLSYLAHQAGLASIVGAFSAGLMLDEQSMQSPHPSPQELSELLAPLTLVFVPVFFVIAGVQVDLSVFKNLNVLVFALILTFVATVGKFSSALGVTLGAAKTANRWIVGLGMIPRGEVGLIFAGVGLALTYQGRSIVPPDVYSATVIMVVLTTAVTPPALAWAFGRKRA